MIGADFATIFKWSEKKLGPVDDFQKDLIWRWLVERNEDVNITSGLKGLQESQYKGKSFEQVSNEFQDLRVFATENLQWLTLTGKEKEASSVSLIITCVLVILLIQI